MSIDLNSIFYQEGVFVVQSNCGWELIKRSRMKSDNLKRIYDIYGENDEYKLIEWLFQDIFKSDIEYFLHF
jgi:deoxyhypusine synthase